MTEPRPLKIVYRIHDIIVTPELAKTALEICQDMKNDFQQVQDELAMLHDAMTNRGLRYTTSGLTQIQSYLLRDILDKANNGPTT